MARNTGRPGRLGFLVALLTAAFAGCDGAATQSALSVRDSAGIRITASDAASRGTDRVCSLTEAPDTRVTSPASGEWMLYRIEDLDRMEDGRLVVVNRGSQELFVFGRDGEFVRSLGGRGEGPGSSWTPSSSISSATRSLCGIGGWEDSYSSGLTDLTREASRFSRRCPIPQGEWVCSGVR